MPDTGAPWNIPYADPTDLVRDWPQLSEDIAEAVADGLDAAGPAGIGSNAVQTLKADTFSTASTTYTPITGLSVTITPTTDTSKVLVSFSFSLTISALATAAVRLMRGATAIGGGTAAGSRLSAIAKSTTGASNYAVHVSGEFLDSPGSDAATTYSVEIATNTGTLYLGRSVGDDDNAATSNARMSSVITAIEVKP